MPGQMPGHRPPLFRRKYGDPPGLANIRFFMRSDKKVEVNKYNWDLEPNVVRVVTRGFAY